MHKLVVCAIARDEGPFLDEWLAFYKAVGVSHVYLYDNESKDETKQVLSLWSDFVTVTDWGGQPTQIPAYNHFIKTRKKECEWVAFLDCDEFLRPLNSETLTDNLVRFDLYGGVAVNWRCFGTSGHPTRPPGLVIENFTKRNACDSGINQNVKCILRSNDLISCTNPHVFVSRRKIIMDDFSRASKSHGFSSGRFYLVNHYVTRSAEDLERKLAKGRADSKEPRNFDFSIYEKDLTVDLGIQPLVKKVKSLMRAKGVKDALHSI